MRFLEIGNVGGDFPFAKIQCKGERLTRSAVCTSWGFRSLRPCPRNGVSLREEAVLADSGQAGEMAAGVGWVRCLDFLSILLGSYRKVRREPIADGGGHSVKILSPSKLVIGFR